MFCFKIFLWLTAILPIALFANWTYKEEYPSFDKDANFRKIIAYPGAKAGMDLIISYDG